MMVKLSYRKSNYIKVVVISFFIAVSSSYLYAERNRAIEKIMVVSDDPQKEGEVIKEGNFSGIWLLKDLEVYRYNANGDSARISSGDLPGNSVTGIFPSLNFNENTCSVILTYEPTKKEIESNGNYDMSGNNFILYASTTPFNYTILNKEMSLMTLFHKYTYSGVLYGVKLTYTK